VITYYVLEIPKQLHPEDSLTLRIVGIFIDPTHEKVPLHFRLNFALKRTLLMSSYSACIMNHLYDNVQVSCRLLFKCLNNIIRYVVVFGLENMLIKTKI
jgi:hypothetical protein